MAKRKNIMKEFTINEISGVDVPAQVGASAAIMKRFIAKSGKDKPNNKETAMTEEEKLKLKKAKAKAKAQAAAAAADADDEDDIDEDDADDAPAAAAANKKTKKALKAATETLETVQAELTVAKALGEMSDAEKTHYKSLSEDDQLEWLSKSAEDRKAELTDIAKGNPVVYKAADGTEFRKSDDPRLVAMAKRSDASDKAAAEALAKNLNSEFAKRSETEMKNLKGDQETKVAVLKAIEGIADEALRGKAKEILKGANETCGMTFKNAGFTYGKAEEGTPAAQLDTLAKNHAETHKVSFAKAYDAVMQTAEGKKLYDQTQQKK